MKKTLFASRGLAAVAALVLHLCIGLVFVESSFLLEKGLNMPRGLAYAGLCIMVLLYLWELFVVARGTFYSKSSLNTSTTVTPGGQDIGYFSCFGFELGFDPVRLSELFQLLRKDIEVLLGIALGGPIVFSTMWSWYLRQVSNKQWAISVDAFAVLMLVPTSILMSCAYNFLKRAQA